MLTALGWDASRQLVSLELTVPRHTPRGNTPLRSDDGRSHPAQRLHGLGPNDRVVSLILVDEAAAEADAEASLLTPGQTLTWTWEV